MQRITTIGSRTAHDTILVSGAIGTKFLNFLNNTAVDYTIVYTEHENTIMRHIETELGIMTTRKILADLAEASVSMAVHCYYEGEYTGGSIPSLAWYNGRK